MFPYSRRHAQSMRTLPNTLLCTRPMQVLERAPLHLLLVLGHQIGWIDYPQCFKDHGCID